MRRAPAMLTLVLLTGAAGTQATFDARGRRYPCLPGDWSFTVQPPPGASLPAKRRP